jgi:two-component system response regulator FixJ
LSNIDIVVHIVDDEETVRNSLAFLLASSGFAVRTHESAVAFLDFAPTIRNGCLITDLRMPDMDGVELLRRLREADALLPAIVITGHGDVQMAVEAMKHGALDFIEKPFSDDVLLDSIRRAVDRAETDQERSSSRRNQGAPRIAERPRETGPQGCGRRPA